LPAQGDFVRAGCGDFTRLGLDRWFAEGVEAVAAGGRPLPGEPVAFLLSPQEGGMAFVGAFAPSEDAVGRAFPLALFVALPTGRLGETFPVIPSSYGVFLEAATALLAQAGSMTPEQLVAAAAALPTAESGASGADVAPLLARAPLSDLAGAIGGLREGGPYALRTLLTACDQARKAGGGDGRTSVITVDAPAPNDGARLFWLELTRRRLGWSDAVPSMLWTRRGAGRLLLALGPPPPTMLAYLANASHRSQRFWPLRTDVRAAGDAALAALGPEQRRAVELQSGSLLDLLGAVAGR